MAVFDAYTYFFNIVMIDPCGEMCLASACTVCLLPTATWICKCLRNCQPAVMGQVARVAKTCREKNHSEVDLQSSLASQDM